MKIFTKKPPWYAAGLAFECVGCGRCCAGPHEGYVWVSGDRIAEIAGYLGISVPEMREKYVRKVHGRYSLIEQAGNNDCVFLINNGAGRRKCAIYPVRPTQCRTWPFWKSNLRSPHAWASAGERCLGINRGNLIPYDEIEAKRNATSE